MPKISFELARPDALELLIEMMRRLRDDDPDEGAFNENNARASTPPLISDTSIGRLWLIHADDEPVGYVALTFDWSLELGGRVGFVDELFIERAHRGQGIGSRALEFVDQAARTLNVVALLLEVTCSNESAKRLYERCGYVDRNHRLMCKGVEL